MVKVTYKNMDGVLVKVWFGTVEQACDHVRRLLPVANGYVKVEMFEEVSVE